MRFDRNKFIRKIRMFQNMLNEKNMIKEIEQITDEDLAAIWPAIGGAPHLFEYGKDELKAVLLKGYSDNDDEPISLQLDFYTMAAIVDILHKRGFATNKWTKEGELIETHEQIVKDKWEERAKFWEDKLPNLAKALRSESLQKSCEDIEEFHGWIRIGSSTPKDDELVLVTNGKDVWMGDYNSKRSVRDGKWSVVYDGAPPFDSTQIIAWHYMIDVPPQLLNSEQAV